MAQPVPGQAQPAPSPTSLPSWAGPGCLQQSLSSPPHLLQPESQSPVEDMGLASPLRSGQGLAALPWPWSLAKLTCPFQSWRLCSARRVVWEEVMVPDTRA